MSGFNVFRRDRVSTTGGGVAILSKTKLETKPVLLPRFNTFEAVAIQILHQDGLNSTIVSVYKPPMSNFDTNEWDCLLQTLPPNQRLIIAGDLNCKNIDWGCSSTSANGIELEAWSNLNNLSIYSSGHPSHGIENWDLFMCSEEINVLQPRRGLESLPFPSDHLAIVLRCEMARGVASNA